MKFTLIDIASYPRRKHFEYFRQTNLSYSVTVPIDITELVNILRKRKLKAYPAHIWLLTTAANHVQEFRMGFDEQGQLGFWDFVSPLYATLYQETKSVSLICTEYEEDFSKFYSAYLHDTEAYCNGHFTPQWPIVPNKINISSLPWLDFSSISFSAMPACGFNPQFVIGKYEERDGRIIMPLSITAHHAVCDGYHIWQAVEQVRDLARKCSEWI